MNKITLIFVIIYTTFASDTYASCVQANMAGLWQDFALAYEAGTVAKCTFHLDKNGNVLSDSVCYNYSGTSDYPPINVLSGSFKISKVCAVTATLGADNGITAFFKGQMHISKNALNGISRNSSGNIALHNFVRQ